MISHFAMDDDRVCFGTRFYFGFALNRMKSDEKKLLFLSEANFRGTSTRLSGLHV
jgi:hypothetical protein